MTSSSYAGSGKIARSPRAGRRQITTFETELGWMAASWFEGQLARLTFGHGSPQAAVARLAVEQDPGKATPAMDALRKRLQAFAAGDRQDNFLDVPLLISDMTPFQQAVLRRCRRIPPGHTLSYAELASAAGYPGAARAVGRVMATNRFPLLVPCHRVVAAGGAIGGFSAPEGIHMKRRLLAPEQTIRGRR